MAGQNKRGFLDVTKILRFDFRIDLVLKRNGCITVTEGSGRKVFRVEKPELFFPIKAHSNRSTAQLHRLER